MAKSSTSFQKGKSGNPGGVPSETSEASRDVRLLALNACPGVIRSLIRRAEELSMESDLKAIQVCLSIQKELLDRGIGKPLQSMQIASSAETKHPADMTNAELNMFIQGDFFGAVRQMHKDGRLAAILSEPTVNKAAQSPDVVNNRQGNENSAANTCNEEKNAKNTEEQFHSDSLTKMLPDKGKGQIKASSDTEGGGDVSHCGTNSAKDLKEKIHEVIALEKRPKKQQK